MPTTTARQPIGKDIYGTIFNIQRYSISDGPGIRTTVFFKGCPLSCQWCHNPESQARHAELIFHRKRCLGCGACALHCLESAISVDGLAKTRKNVCVRCGTCVDYCFTDARELVGKELSCIEVMDVIEKDRSFYDQSRGGVTLSGGEPLDQADFAKALLEMCCAAGIHTALDTSGFAPWDTIDALRSHVDLFLYDLKIIDDTKHQMHVGVSNQPILDNLNRLDENGHTIILRIPIVPGVTDDEENIEAIVNVAKSLSNVRQIDILPYHHIAAEKYDRLQLKYQLSDCRPPKSDHMVTVKSLIEKANIRVSIGG